MLAMFLVGLLCWLFCWLFGVGLFCWLFCCFVSNELSSVLSNGLSNELMVVLIK
jgi:hypothetical protein